jgi:hypothetical protein
VKDLMECRLRHIRHILHPNRSLDPISTELRRIPVAAGFTPASWGWLNTEL